MGKRLGNVEDVEPGRNDSSGRKGRSVANAPRPGFPYPQVPVAGGIALSPLLCRRGVDLYSGALKFQTPEDRLHLEGPGGSKGKEHRASRGGGSEQRPGRRGRVGDAEPGPAFLWNYILSSLGLWDNESEPLMEKCLSVYKGLLASFIQSFFAMCIFPRMFILTTTKKL